LRGSTGPTGPIGPRGPAGNGSANVFLTESYINNGINLVVPTTGVTLTVTDTLEVETACFGWFSVPLGFISTDTLPNTLQAYIYVNGANQSNVYQTTISGMHRMIVPGYLQCSFQHYAPCQAGSNLITVTITCPTSTNGLVKLQQYNIFALGNL
jgi:hypothetical protein